MKSANRVVKIVFLFSVIVSLPITYFSITRPGGSVLSIATQLAHQSGCHRWHSCPSDSGSYTCGDKGYPCKYPTYSSSANSYTTPTFVPTSKPIVAPSTPRPTTNPIINYEINDQVRDNGGSSSVNGTFALVGTVALASGILWVRDKLRK